MRRKINGLTIAKTRESSNEELPSLAIHSIANNPPVHVEHLVPLITIPELRGTFMALPNRLCFGSIAIMTSDTMWTPSEYFEPDRRLDAGSKSGFKRPE